MSAARMQFQKWDVRLLYAQNSARIQFDLFQHDGNLELEFVIFQPFQNLFRDGCG